MSVTFTELKEPASGMRVTAAYSSRLQSDPLPVA